MGSHNNFKFQESSDGFIIEGADLCSVQVIMNPTWLYVKELDGLIGCKFGFYDFHSMVNFIVLLLIKSSKTVYANLGDLHWGLKKFRMEISKPVKAHWLRLLEKVDPNVLAIHKSIFRSIFPSLTVDMIVLDGSSEENDGSLLELIEQKDKNDPYYLAYSKELYQHKYLVSDIIRYRAAAIAVTKIADYSRDYILVHKHINSNHIDLMENWRGMFSPTGAAYTSLNKTLMKLPPFVPANLVYRLNKFNLSRPLINRTEFLLNTLYRNREYNNGQIHESIMIKSSSHQILGSLRMVATETGNKLDGRRTSDMKFLVSYLCDYPEEYRGNILGLSNKCIRWHREIHPQRYRVVSIDTSKKDITVPPIPLPDNLAIKFISTAAEFEKESERMQHCVVSHVYNAIYGDSYYFHIDYMNEMATVQVDSRGNVIQSRGVKNKINIASKYGEIELKKWGEKLKENQYVNKIKP